MSSVKRAMEENGGFMHESTQWQEDLYWDGDQKIGNRFPGENVPERDDTPIESK